MMRESIERRGFQDVIAENYPNACRESRLVGESSIMGQGPADDSRPGSSFLWIGESHLLNRDQVAKLRDYLTHWLETGRLFEGK